MLLHCVFCDILETTAQGEVSAIEAELAALVGKVPGMLAFQAGPNRDYEVKSPNHRWGFVCTFTDRAAHLAYEAHPRHQAAGARLVAACRGGAAGIVVYDLEVPDTRPAA